MAENALAESELLAIEKPVARISWGGIFIGAFATIALGILMHSLGAAIGLSVINPARGEWGRAAGIATGIWSFLSIVIPTFFGAWLASRASTVFFKRDAASLGFMTWALSFLGMLAFFALMANITAASSIQGVGAAAGAAAGGAPGALQQQAQQIQPGQIAQTAESVGQAATWWFFLSALCAMLAGIAGGIAGLPKAAKARMEVRRSAGAMRQREA